jgi:hypothetical protein
VFIDGTPENSYCSYLLFPLVLRHLRSQLHLIRSTLVFGTRLPPACKSQHVEEPCDYKKVSGSTFVFLVLYVDDILLIGNDISMLEAIKSSLRKSFSTKDLGEAMYILGIKIYRDRSKRLIGLSQDAYIDKILNQFNMQDSKKDFLPISHNITHSKKHYPSTPDEEERMSAIPYTSAIGSIMYACYAHAQMSPML